MLNSLEESLIFQQFTFDKSVAYEPALTSNTDTTLTTKQFVRGKLLLAGLLTLLHHDHFKKEWACEDLRQGRVEPQMYSITQSIQHVDKQKKSCNIGTVGEANQEFYRFYINLLSLYCLVGDAK